MWRVRGSADESRSAVAARRCRRDCARQDPCADLSAHPPGLQSEDDLAGQLHATRFQNLVTQYATTWTADDLHDDTIVLRQLPTVSDAAGGVLRCRGERWASSLPRSWVGLSGQAWPDVAVALAIAVDEGFVYGTTCDAGCGSARELRGALAVFARGLEDLAAEPLR